MRTCLIGHTGFVGSNLLSQHPFTACFNSRNIAEIEGQEFDLLVCAGVQAKKWWANQNPEADWAGIEALLSHVQKVRAKRVMVVSTVDVYPAITGVDERADCHAENHAYGRHRLRFEEAMQQQFAECYIYRLSALFGPGLKKNVIYDLMHNNCLEMIQPQSRFQWYDLAGLWADMQRFAEQEVRLVNLVNAPLLTQEIVSLFPGKQVGQQAGPAVSYDIRTQHSPSGYLRDEIEVLQQIKNFVCA